MNFSNPASEKGVLAGLAKHGYDAYIDIADLITSNTFTNKSNSFVFKCFEHILKEEKYQKVDLPTFLSAAHTLGFNNLFDKIDEQKFLRAIFNSPIINCEIVHNVLNL